MKKLLAFLMAVLMLLSLCACGEKDPEVSESIVSEEKTAEEPAEEAGEEPAAKSGAAFDPVTFEFDDYVVVVLGAEEFTDYDGNSAIRIYYDFTNLDEEPQSAWWLNYTAEQAGFELVSTSADYDEYVPEYGNDYLDIYPGVTIRCIEEYVYNPEAGGVVVFTVDDYDNEYSVEFEVGALPGAPADEWEIDLITDPAMTEGLGLTLEGDGYTTVIEDAEVVDGWGDMPVIRIYFTYTNNGEEATSCWMDNSVSVYQDGIELEVEWPDEEVEEDDNYSLDIEPGETIRCAECWELRTDSPVEVLAEDFWNETVAGTSFNVA